MQHGTSCKLGMRNEEFWYALLCNAFIIGDATSVALVGLKSQPLFWNLRVTQ